MSAPVSRLMPALLVLLAASCGNATDGGDPPGDGSGHCVLAAAAPAAGAACCNAMTPDSLGVCRQRVGGPCYSDNLPNSIPSASACCNTNGGATYLGTVATCDEASNCAGDATCRLGTVCFGSGFCGGGCFTVGEGTASAQHPCCAGLTASADGYCYLPAGHACHHGTECLSRVCLAGQTTATCQ